jgi:hypothetical protein
MTKLIFRKKNIQLKEDNNNSKGTAYVEPTSNNTNSLATDLNTTKQQNPTDNTFVVNTSAYDGKETTNPVSLDVNAQNPTDAARKFQELRQNPHVKNLMNNTPVLAKIHLQTEQVHNLKESSISFSKKELKELLKK